jgi:hypothetical protein
VHGNGGLTVGVGIIVGSAGISATIVSEGSNTSLVVAIGDVLLQPVKKIK